MDKIGIWMEGDFLYYYFKNKIFIVQAWPRLRCRKRKNNGTWYSYDKIYIDCTKRSIGHFCMLDSWDSRYYPEPLAATVARERGSRYEPISMNINPQEWHRDNKDAVQKIFDDFFSRIPVDVLDAISQFPDYRNTQFKLLKGVCKNRYFFDLIKSNPALAVCLSHREFVINSNATGSKSRFNDLVVKKQRELARIMGFDQSGLTVLKKVIPPACDIQDLLALRGLCRCEGARDILKHLPMLSPHVLYFLNWHIRRLQKYSIRYSFLYDIIASFKVIDRGAFDLNEVCCDMSDLISMYWDLTNFAPSVEIENIHDLNRRHERMINELTTNEFSEDDCVYVNPPIAGTDIIIPVKSRKDLFYEGKVQHNCVFSYEHYILSGQVYIYRLMEPQRCTVSIVNDHGTWKLGECKASRNRKALRAAMDVVLSWIGNRVYEDASAYYDECEIKMLMEDIEAKFEEDIPDEAVTSDSVSHRSIQ